MSKKRGISADEKKQRMLQMFYEKKEFYQLKELEKLAPKEKGIVAQSVKDVLQSLVDDGLVESDKIGTSVYFWAFPSKKKHNKKQTIEQLEKQVERVKSNLTKAREKIIQAKVGREDLTKRQEVLQENQRLKAEKEKLLEEIKAMENRGPSVDKLKKDVEIAKEAANRWTDNIFSVKTWCKRKFFLEDDVLNKQFGIQPDLDYIN